MLVGSFLLEGMEALFRERSELKTPILLDLTNNRNR